MSDIYDNVDQVGKRDMNVSERGFVFTIFPFSELRK